MKKILTITLILFCSHAFAQDSLKVFNTNRIRTTSTGMEILGSWGITNLAAGTFGWNGAAVGETRYFYQMNVIWGAANFGTALLSYASLQRERKKQYTAAEILAEQKKVEKIFLINGALDIGYIGVGSYLKLAGDSRNSPIMKGYGTSVLMQGGFLLIFDGLMYHAEKSNGHKLARFLEKHPITFDGKKVGMILNM